MCPVAILNPVPRLHHDETAFSLSPMDGEKDLVDPFKQARRESGMLPCKIQGETIPMILRHSEVRKAAKDIEKFSSDAPFRVPIPSEEEVRTVRQLPIETDPPVHTEYRAIVEPFFKRSKTPEVTDKVSALVDRMISSALEAESIDVVQEFSLPIQSRALTYLLNEPESEADLYISWGTHVFKSTEGGFKSGNPLEDYLNQRFDHAEANPGEDFFSALTKATFQGRPLTREEMVGFANLTFAGGRDTVIHTISSTLAYLGRNQKALECLRDDPKRIVLASEEFIRAYTPLTHLGRVCPADTDVSDFKVKAGDRVSLCWAAANFDDEVFSNPETIQLDRKPNPHLSFGFGAHLCLGAAHARLILRTILKALIERVESIQILEAIEQKEIEASYERVVGYEQLKASFTPIRSTRA